MGPLTIRREKNTKNNKAILTGELRQGPWGGRSYESRFGPGTGSVWIPIPSFNSCLAFNPNHAGPILSPAK